MPNAWWIVGLVSYGLFMGFLAGFAVGHSRALKVVERMRRELWRTGGKTT